MVQTIPMAFKNSFSAHAPEKGHHFDRNVFHKALINEVRDRNFLVVDMLRSLEG
jgi:hypothetical protein